MYKYDQRYFYYTKYVITFYDPALSQDSCMLTPPQLFSKQRFTDPYSRIVILSDFMNMLLLNFCQNSIMFP